MISSYSAEQIAVAASFDKLDKIGLGERNRDDVMYGLCGCFICIKTFCGTFGMNPISHAPKSKLTILVGMVLND